MFAVIQPSLLRSTDPELFFTRIFEKNYRALVFIQ